MYSTATKTVLLLHSPALKSHSARVYLLLKVVMVPSLECATRSWVPPSPRTRRTFREGGNSFGPYALLHILLGRDRLGNGHNDKLKTIEPHQLL
jgi:hypothetical protein